MEWAAEQSATEKGKSIKVPVGKGCMRCWRVGVDVLGYDTFAAYAKDYHKDKAVQEKTAEVVASLENASREVSWEKAAVERDTSFSLEFTKTFRAYTDLSLRKRVSCTRLTQKATKDLVDVTGPSLDSPGEEVTYFLFPREANYPDGDDGVDVRVTATRNFSLKAVLMPAAGCLYEQHASEFRTRALKKDSVSKIRNLFSASKPVPRLDEFVNNYEGHVRARNATASLSRGASAVEISGPAAGEYEVVEDTPVEPEAENILLDLTDAKVQSKDAPRVVTAAASAVSGEGGDDTMDRDDSDEGDMAGHSFVDPLGFPVSSDFVNTPPPLPTIFFIIIFKLACGGLFEAVRCGAVWWKLLSFFATFPQN